MYYSPRGTEKVSEPGLAGNKVPVTVMGQTQALSIPGIAGTNQQPSTGIFAAMGTIDPVSRVGAAALCWETIASPRCG